MICNICNTSNTKTRRDDTKTRRVDTTARRDNRATETATRTERELASFNYDISYNAFNNYYNSNYIYDVFKIILRGVQYVM